ncbi:hypothetical protein JQK88_10395 [Mesorhizobium caraganae]|uniref:hypothetical protein n=1 Tax=Mesorhizobium caraganae TaxID=483206 RepID=UPI00193ADD9F|nr:hypothetical protein [Mesorhizobium caraganae]MBM2711656.1 hypothetical protein [Mesorhizobium caraganae]
MTVRIVGCEYEQTEDDPYPRLFAKAKYGIQDVLIPLDAVYVDGDSPLEEMLASAAAARRLAHALLLYSDGIENSQSRRPPQGG